MHSWQFVKVVVRPDMIVKGKDGVLDTRRGEATYDRVDG
jgi:hypothetical protein